MKAKQKYFKIISSFLVCVCLLCIFHADAYAQNADVQQGDESSEEYVTARVVIGNTSRASGDPNADVDGDGGKTSIWSVAGSLLQFHIWQWGIGSDIIFFDETSI